MDIDQADAPPHERPGLDEPEDLVAGGHGRSVQGLEQRQDFTALIGQAGEQVRGIYEADYRDFNRETYARGRETFDETWAAVKALILGSWRRDELAAGGAP